MCIVYIRGHVIRALNHRYISAFLLLFIRCDFKTKQNERYDENIVDTKIFESEQTAKWHTSKRPIPNETYTYRGTAIVQKKSRMSVRMCTHIKID